MMRLTLFEIFQNLGPTRLMKMQYLVKLVEF